MDNFRGLCTRCGIAHSDTNHACTDDQIRLMEIDRDFGSRPVREFMLAQGYKGHQNKVEAAENEAATIRNKNK